MILKDLIPKTLKDALLNNYISPVISFYKVNDIMLNTKKINRFMPPKTRVKKNRGYEHEEIQKLVQPLKEVSTNFAKKKARIYGANSRAPAMGVIAR